jgi:GNAT superfamily N-acetyltransferase
MQDGATIEQMKLSEKDEVLAFLRKAYAENPRQSGEKFWDWHFPESPFCDSRDLPVWLAKVDGRIAGQLAAVPVEFNVADETVPAIWILDLIVDPEFRRRGIAKKLALASKEFCPFVLGVNTPKQHAPKLLEGLGWKIFSKIPRYQKILFPGNAMHEIARLAPLRSVANLAFAPFRRGAISSEVKIVDTFDSRFDELWDRARIQWPCSISRTARMLDWQFRRQPDKKFEILAHVSGGELRGFAVMFFRKPNQYGFIDKASISDICYGPDDPDGVLDALIRGALSLAIERRAGSVVTDAIDGRLERRLKHAGFWRVKSDLQLLANVPRSQDIVYDAANWYLTRGDSDISIFEAPNL